MKRRGEDRAGAAKRLRVSFLTCEEAGRFWTTPVELGRRVSFGGATWTMNPSADVLRLRATRVTTDEARERGRRDDVLSAMGERLLHRHDEVRALHADALACLRDEAESVEETYVVLRNLRHQQRELGAERARWDGYAHANATLAVTARVCELALDLAPNRVTASGVTTLAWARDPVVVQPVERRARREVLTLQVFPPRLAIGVVVDSAVAVGNRLWCARPDGSIEVLSDRDATLAILRADGEDRCHADLRVSEDGRTVYASWLHMVRAFDSATFAVTGSLSGALMTEAVHRRGVVYVSTPGGVAAFDDCSLEPCPSRSVRTVTHQQIEYGFKRNPALAVLGDDLYIAGRRLFVYDLRLRACVRMVELPFVCEALAASTRCLAMLSRDDRIHYYDPESLAPLARQPFAATKGRSVWLDERHLVVGTADGVFVDRLQPEFVR